VNVTFFRTVVLARVIAVLSVWDPPIGGTQTDMSPAKTWNPPIGGTRGVT
jgi:hypothetical protein